MLKKILGGLSLLIFTFAFTMPLLVITRLASSTDNRLDYHLYRVHRVCPDGSVIGSYDEWRSVTWTENHPPRNCAYWNFGDENNPDWQFACLHIDHGYTYRVYDTPTNTNLYISGSACR